MKYYWKIPSEPEIMKTHLYFNGRLSIGRLFSRLPSQYSIMLQNKMICLDYPFFHNFGKRKRSGISFQIYFGKHHITFVTNKETLEYNKRFFALNGIKQ